MAPPKAAQHTFEDLLEGVDPKGLLEGTGKGLRHVKIRSVKDAASPALRSLVAAGLALRKKG